jgi:hypothetical protein
MGERGEPVDVAFGDRATVEAAEAAARAARQLALELGAACLAGVGLLAAGGPGEGEEREQCEAREDEGAGTHRPLAARSAASQR